MNAAALQQAAGVTLLFAFFAFGFTQFIGSRAVQWTSDSALRRLKIALGLTVFGFGGVCYLFIDESMDDVAASLVTGSTLVEFTGMFFSLVAVWVVAVAGYRGASPAIRKIRRDAVEGVALTRRFARMTAVILPLLGGTLLLLDPTVAATVPLSGPVFAAVGVTALLVVLYTFSTLGVQVANDTREPTDVERRRLQRCWPDDRDVPTFVVLNRDDQVSITGRWSPFGERVYVSTRTLAAMDDDALATACMFVTEVRDKHVLERFLGSLCLALLVCVVAVSADSVLVLLVGSVVFLVLTIGGLRHVRTTVFAVDEAVSARVGTDAVESFLERSHELNGSARSRGTIASKLHPYPALEPRLERLD
ncbi:hypothetical protein [Haloarchaeobius sp. DFWS5]|uniref:hypothetical protein n=1 Tax=Haloarchaeobius sp. DFWS5 TaxID=3446114 RepID=UPI003EB7B5C5